MRILTTVVFLSIGINVFAQDVEINLCDFNQPIVGTRYIARPVCYDSTGKYATFTINEILFDIKAESGNNHITYYISNQNRAIKELSFCKDSISKWSANQSYDLHAVKFSFNGQSFFFIPGTKIKYNDTIYNKFPCMVSEGDIKRGSFLGNEIYLLRNDSATTLHVKDNGLFHTPASLNGLNYKNEYVVGDTIPLSNQPFIFTEIDWNNSKLRLTPIHNKLHLQKVDSKWLNWLSRHFNNNEYLFIDFWGTWCKPCIQAIPKLKELYATNKKNISFLSVCYDAPENHIRFKEIIDDHKIEWDNCFIPFDAAKGSIVDYLHIESYPSFVLIHKNGDMIFLLSGEKSIAKITHLLEHYK